MELSRYYSYDLSNVKDEIKRRGARRVLIQLPVGLLRLSAEIVRELESEFPETRFYVDGNPTFGSCLIPPLAGHNFDLILHFGHEEYPYYPAPSNVFFVELLSTAKPSEKTLEEVVRELRGREIALYTTPQHKVLLRELRRRLVDSGVKVANPEGTSIILGCWFSNLRDLVKELDAVLVVAGGVFHALGAGLSVRGEVPVYRLDPYEDKFEDVGRVVRKYLSIRLWKMSQAREARNWLVIEGVSGQYRPHLVERLVNLVRSTGRSVLEVVTYLVSEEILRNLDSPDIGAIVVTSCPRVAIEDLSHYEKPVLTPGEAEAVLRGRDLSSFDFPW